MGLKTLAQTGCGLSEGLTNMLKLQLAQKELEQNQGLKDAQAAYYNAQADYLGRSKGKGTGGAGTAGSVVDYITQPDGSILAVPKKVVAGSTITATPVSGVAPGSTRIGTLQPKVSPLAPKGPLDILKTKLSNFLGGGSTATPAPSTPSSVPTFVRGPDGKLHQQ